LFFGVLKLIWLFLGLFFLAAWTLWQESKNNKSCPVTDLIVMALKTNAMRAITTDYDAKRIAQVWIKEASPIKFEHKLIGGITARSTPLGEAMFLVASRLGRNIKPHTMYEEAVLGWLILLTEKGELAGSLTAIDLEMRANVIGTLTAHQAAG
jgi:hypothetical protein